MQIVLNGKPCEVARDRLDGVLQELGYQDSKVATAVNGNFIARPVRAETQIKDGDRVEVIAPMQGG